VLTSALQGEAKEAARALAALAQGVGGAGRFAPFARPCALVIGGETTVTLGGGPVGRGGRNQELALAFAVAMDAAAGSAQSPQGRWTCLAFGTDGVDGPTDAAGAFSTERTVAAARARGLDARDHLRRHDAYTLFARLAGAGAAADDGAAEAGDEGGLVVTGPTGTNVIDVTVLLLP
jgi:hydroxypyruvate reductase